MDLGRVTLTGGRIPNASFVQSERNAIALLVADRKAREVADRYIAKNDLFDNRLIFGDNLLALKALEQELSGKVKCVFVEPPYNTGTRWLPELIEGA